MTRLRRIPALAAVLVLALAFAACQRDVAPAEPNPSTVDFLYSTELAKAEAVQDGLSSSRNVSEAYLLERIHADWAHQLAIVMGHLWYKSPPKYVSTRTWPDDHKVTVGYAECDTSLVVTFKALAYDPERSSISYGETTVHSSNPVELPGHSYLYDLTESEEPGQFSQEDTITLEQSRSTTLSKTTDFNVTASSSTKVGGTLAGVGLEETINIATGLDFKTEKSQAQAESMARTETHSFSITLPPLRATLITLDTTEVASSTPFRIYAVATFAPEIKIGDHCAINYPSKEFQQWQIDAGCWITDEGCYGTHKANLDWCPAKKSDAPWLYISRDGCKVSFESIDRVDEFLRGVHERWPGMGRWGAWVYARCFHHSDCHAAYEALKDAERRRINLIGTQHRTYENAIEERVANVTGQDLSSVLMEHSAKSCDPVEESC